MILTDWSSIAVIGSIVWAHLIYNNFARENRLKLQIKKQFEHYLAFKTRDSYNTDAIAQSLASAALRSQDYARETWQKVRASRTKLQDELTALGFAALASQSNFLLSTVPANHSAEKLYEALKAQGILVRYFDQDRLRDKLRISIGSAEEKERLVEALKKLIA